jgi:DNA-binding CsgD family transcriptional regulator
VRLIADGFSDKQIAAQLGISRHTVRSQIDRAFAKHGIHSRASLVMVWVTSREVV